MFYWRSANHISSLIVSCLAIRLPAQVFYQRIGQINKAQLSWLSLIDNVGKLSNCFSRDSCTIVFYQGILKTSNGVLQFLSFDWLTGSGI